MFDLRCLIFDVKKRSRPRCAPRTSTIKHPPSNILLTSNILSHQQSNISHQTSPRGLTLIELLVVIVILTTLVAGVIPVLSPNNDTRRIREATRMLQTYIVQAQAEAARTGRAHGISFRESSPGSGVALDVYQISVPPTFTGFASASTVRVEQEILTGILNLQFMLADTLDPLATVPDEYDPDLIPPKFLRLNDIVSIGGFHYRLIDTVVDTDGYYNATAKLRVELTNNGGQTLAFVKSHPLGVPTHQLTAPKAYKIMRQPTAAAGFAVTPGATAEAPLQLPSSIGIDMQGSIAEGSSDAFRFPTTSSLFDPGATNTVGIMFSPTGTVSSVFLNGNPLTNVSRLVLLLGRVENGGLPFPSPNPASWEMDEDATSEQIKEKQEIINWLNLDTRWLSIATNSGRVVVTENAFVNPKSLGNPSAANADDQIEAAHAFAHEMRSTGAGR